MNLKKKNIKRKIIVFMYLLILLIFLFNFKSLAVNIETNDKILKTETIAIEAIKKDSYSENAEFSVGGIINSVREFFSRGSSNTTGIDAQEIRSNFIVQIQPIVDALFTIGIGVALGVSIVLGVQYMAGDAKKKAELKDKLLGFVIGIFILGSAFTIWSITVRILSGAIGIEI